MYVYVISTTEIPRFARGSLFLPRLCLQPAGPSRAGPSRAGPDSGPDGRDGTGPGRFGNRFFFSPVSEEVASLSPQS